MLLEMRHYRRQKTMTLLNSNSGYSDASYIRERARSIGRRLSILINRWVATIIARREQQASLAVLRYLSDRELRDIGIYRGQIREGLEDAARYRASRQYPII
jgi:uncharacterized protein YjiS (DUF1127 family)